MKLWGEIKPLEEHSVFQGFSLACLYFFNLEPVASIHVCFVSPCVKKFLFSFKPYFLHDWHNIFFKTFLRSDSFKCNSFSVNLIVRLHSLDYLSFISDQLSKLFNYSLFFFPLFFGSKFPNFYSLNFGHFSELPNKPLFHFILPIFIITLHDVSLFFNLVYNLYPFFEAFLLLSLSHNIIYLSLIIFHSEYIHY